MSMEDSYRKDSRYPNIRNIQNICKISKRKLHGWMIHFKYSFKESNIFTYLNNICLKFLQLAIDNSNLWGGSIRKKKKKGPIATKPPFSNSHNFFPIKGLLAIFLHPAFPLCVFVFEARQLRRRAGALLFTGGWSCAHTGDAERRKWRAMRCLNITFSLFSGFKQKYVLQMIFSVFGWASNWKLAFSKPSLFSFIFIFQFACFT